MSRPVTRAYADEFTGPAAALSADGKWACTPACSGGAARLDGRGHLAVRAAQLSTRSRMSFGYGTLSLRVAVPAGASAGVQLVGSDLGEVGYPWSGDIALLAADSGRMSQSVHGPTGTGRTWTVADASTTMDARWHVYSIRHDDHELRLSVDGHRVITLQRSAGDRTWVFDKSFDVVLSGTLDVDRISYQPAATR